MEADIYGDGTNRAYRSKDYELFKAQLNPLADGAVDLILTGDFVKAMYLRKPKQGRYLFGNRDWKRKMLSQKYGEGIFSLNQEKFSKFQIDFIKNIFIRKIKQRAKIR